MTCITALNFVITRKINFKEMELSVSKFASRVPGSSAFIKDGDLIKLWDLLHGLMLPSGNDAATCIAENLGAMILEEKSESSENTEEEKKQSSEESE
jgi:D-alanyl-D-alanine carboxypeptidase (penicillin-binding protein 5/6)